jgi:magnesium-protoporphyrin O-methyltransferase
VNLARERTPDDLGRGSIDYLVGDMSDARLGRFDHVVGMDSLIHYRAPDMARVVADLAARTDVSLVFTFAPRTPLLSVLHAVGKLFPRGDRAPAIEPVGAAHIRRLLTAPDTNDGWELGRTERVASGFYTSQALELVCK